MGINKPDETMAGKVRCQLLTSLNPKSIKLAIPGPPPPPPPPKNLSLIAFQREECFPKATEVEDNRNEYFLIRQTTRAKGNRWNCWRKSFYVVSHMPHTSFPTPLAFIPRVPSRISIVVQAMHFHRHNSVCSAFETATVCCHPPDISSIPTKS
nr:hypothetical protein HmN_000295800 [Hymenolepis microstoma]